MATDSITHNFVIEGEDKVNHFIDAIEKSAAQKMTSKQSKQSEEHSNKEELINCLLYRKIQMLTSILQNFEKADKIIKTERKSYKKELEEFFQILQDILVHLNAEDEIIYLVNGLEESLLENIKHLNPWSWFPKDVCGLTRYEADSMELSLINKQLNEILTLK